MNTALNNRPARLLIDGLQYCNYSEKIFREMRAGGLSAVHATICYHEDFKETVANIVRWNGWFERHADLIFPGLTGDDIRKGHAEGRTAIFFGLQNCSPIEDDIGLVEICHMLGVRFMQLTYNNQSLLATGCYETTDHGLTRMGREVIAEMNRVGMVVDMSHSGDRSTLEAIEVSRRPISITHANPKSWREAVRNKPDHVLKALAASGGMLGFSLYAHHLKNGPACTLRTFCEMVARTTELIGIDAIGIGSDLCQDHPNSVVEWMRRGTWTKVPASDAEPAVWPPQPDWCRSNAALSNIAAGLAEVGFSNAEVDRVLGLNWLAFYDISFAPMAAA